MRIPCVVLIVLFSFFSENIKGGFINLGYNWGLVREIFLIGVKFVKSKFIFLILKYKILNLVFPKSSKINS